MKSSDYIDAIKERHSLRSDYAASKLIGISPNRISNYRTNRSDFDGDIIPRIAELLSMDAAVIVADIAAARAKTTFERDAFSRLAALARAATVAASVTVITVASAGFISGNDAYTCRTLTDMLESVGDNSRKRRKSGQPDEKTGKSEVSDRPPKANFRSIIRRTVEAFAGVRMTGAAYRAWSHAGLCIEG